MPEDRFQVARGTSGPIAAEKGKGCDALIAFEGANDSVNVFLGGVGVASFSNDTTNPPQTLAEIMSPGPTAMEWVSNRFSATNDALGDINVTFQTIGNSSTRSSLVLIPESDSSLLPARMVNVLYLEMGIPRQGVTLFNKDPLVLESRSTNINTETFKQDPRFVRDPLAVTTRLRDVAAGVRLPEFLPIGKHRQTKPVSLYNKADPEQRVATILNSTVHVVPHYGLELKLVSTGRVGDEIFAEIELANLTQIAQEVRWYVEGIHNLTVTSQQEGRVQLGARNGQDSRSRLRVCARKKDPNKALSQLDCVVVGAHNTPQNIDDFVSDCLLLCTE